MPGDKSKIQDKASMIDDTPKVPVDENPTATPLGAKRDQLGHRDILASGKLAVDGVLAVTDIVEAMHHTISTLGGVLGDAGKQRTSGITGMVYQSVRGISTLVGSALDLPLKHLAELTDGGSSSSEREALLSALNGVMGDYLAATSNPLAIKMQFRQRGKALDKDALSELVHASGGRLCILVHGLCMNDGQWQGEGQDSIADLAAEAGLSPLYLHYNSGRHVSENGSEFADLLAYLESLSAIPLSLTMVCHSMGGLVCRSAFHRAERAGHRWPASVKSVVFLGTPHHGAVLEKGGNWLENLLQVNPYSAPFAKLAKLRSAGVTDLRYGFVSEEDWQGKDVHALSSEPEKVVSLPESVACYALAGTIHHNKLKPEEPLIGDGLVTVNSALGRHRRPEKTLQFAPDRQWILRGVHHMALLNHPEVLAILARILEE